MNPLSRLINIFVAPQATMEAEREKPMWYIPLIIFLALTAVSSVILKPVTMQLQLEKMEESMEKQGMTREQIDQAMERVQNMNPVMMIVPQVLTQLVMFVIIAALWLFVGNVLIGSAVKFSHMLSVTAYSWMVVIVGMLIKSPIMLSKESINVHFSPTVLLSDETTFLYKVLAQFDLFNIWCFFIVTIGMAVMTRRPSRSIWPWTALFFLIYFIGTAAIQSAFGM